VERSSVFERRAGRAGQVVVRVSSAERIELERLAQKSGCTLSDILREGLRRLHADAECTLGVR
jgi:hypothetical protein